MVPLSCLIGLLALFSLDVVGKSRTWRQCATHQCSGPLPVTDLPSLDEASIDELSVLLSSGMLTSIDLVHAGLSVRFLFSHKLRSKDLYPTHQ